MNLPSPLLEQAVKAFTRLPGIGQKTALRLVLHLLKQDPEQVASFTESIRLLRQDIRFCQRCHFLSAHTLCDICSNPSRQHQTVCVVESIKEVLAIEATQQYHGAYHVLGGVISPLDGIGPDKLHLDSLLERVRSGSVEELVFALNPNMLGDLPVKITTISRGIAFGGELEYADEMTLARSIQNRLPVDNLVRM
jgi:recombination protein RecR